MRWAARGNLAMGTAPATLGWYAARAFAVVLTARVKSAVQMGVEDLAETNVMRKNSALKVFASAEESVEFVAMTARSALVEDATVEVPGQTATVDGFVAGQHVITH
jgi:hypothetical protein